MRNLATDVATEAQADDADVRPHRRRAQQALLLWCRFAPLAFVLLGTEIRIRQFIGARALWLDEAMISGNIVNRSFPKLLHRLDNYQAAPVFWLWAERTCVHLFGTGERALRLIPLLAGIVVLLGTWRLAHRIVSPWLVPLAVAAVALSPRLIYYSNEVKQYSTDTAVVLIVILLGLWAADAETGSVRANRRLVLFCSCSAVLLWASYPAAFAAAGVSAVLGLRVLRERCWRALPALAVGGGVLLASVALEYEVSLKALTKVTQLSGYWAAKTPPQPHSLADGFGWATKTIASLLRNPVEVEPVWLSSILLGVGLLVLVNRLRWGSAIVLAPFLVWGAVASQGSYPLIERIALPVTVLAVVLFAASVESARVLLQARPPLAAGLAGALVLALCFMEAGPVSAALPQAVHAQQLEELPSVLTAVAKERQPDDIVLIEAWATKAFPLYANKLHFRSNGVYVIVGAKTGCDDAAFLRRTGFADHRVWLITSSQYRIRPDFNAAELAHFTLLSRISKTIVRTGAAAYLLEPDPSATHAPADPKKCAFLLWNPPA